MFKFLASKFIAALNVGIIGGADGPTTVLVSNGDTMFEPMNFVKNLSYMGVGMLGIFIVIGLIWIVTFFLNKIFSGKKDGE